VSAENPSALMKLFQWISENPPAELSPVRAHQALYVLMASIHAPDDLECFGMLLDTHAETLDRLEYVANEYDRRLIKNTFLLDEQKIVIRHLLATEGMWATLINKELRKNEFVPGVIRTNHPMHGRLTDFAFYSMAISTYDDADNGLSKVYYTLKSIMLLAHWKLIIEVSNLKEPEDESDKTTGGYLRNATAAMVNASRLIRQCRQNVLFNTYYQLHDINSADLLFDRLLGEANESEAVSAASDKTSSALRYSILGFINRAFGTSRHLDKKGGGGQRGRKGGTPYWHDGYIFYTNGVQSEQSPISTGSVISTITVPAKDAKPQEWLQADLDPSENLSENEWILPSDKMGTGRLLTRRSVRHIEMHNQNFRTAWTQASCAEITEFLSTFEKILNNENASGLTRQTAFLALTMFWTGTPLDHAVKHLRYVSMTSPVKIKGSLVIAHESTENENYFYVTPYTARQQFRPNDDQQRYCEPNLQRLRIPDQMGLASYASKIFDLNVTNESQSLFDKEWIKKGAYRPALKKILESIPGESRLNEHRISSFLAHKMATEFSGDVAEAVLLTGRYSTLGQTLLHYSAFQPSYLQKIYSKVARDICEKTERSYSAERSSLSDNAKDTTLGRIGSQMMPNVNHIKIAIENMISTVRKHRGKNTTEAIIYSHNIYAMYTVMMQGFATGYRAVTDPFPAEDSIDEETGLCVISDKDGEDYYNSRLIWIPPIVLKQKALFSEHRKKIIPIIHHRHPGLVDDLPEVFLLDEQFKPVPVRPGTAAPILSDFIPLPLNTNRRFLRTRMREMGCPGEVTNAFMGHWGRGQEPWGRYSSVSPMQMIESVKPYVESILAELCFKTLRGPLK